MTTTVMPSIVFLLVGEGHKTPWVRAVQRALADLGQVDSVTEEQALEALGRNHHDVALINAGRVRDAALTTSCLRASQPDLCVVVFTASPTWQRAREVYRAGAIDYRRKSLDEKEIRSVVESALQLPSCGVDQSSGGYSDVRGNDPVCRQ